MGRGAAMPRTPTRWGLHDDVAVGRLRRRSRKGHGVEARLVRPKGGSSEAEGDGLQHPRPRGSTRVTIGQRHRRGFLWEMPPWLDPRRLRVRVEVLECMERDTRKTGWSTSRPGRVSEGKFPGKKREGDASSLREYRVAAATRYTSRTCRKLDTAHLQSQTVNTHTHLLFIYN